ncbi:reticulon-4-interacting protein 1 homolog, mitochondrial-like [Amphiura filiformis]|uniref:reticulon-4-interacting protein 1 homolog, mitochondrial-like n=1 Tax=Amphiura filiformis TaxID=82378 RepID=UPI003B215032
MNHFRHRIPCNVPSTIFRNISRRVSGGNGSHKRTMLAWQINAYGDNSNLKLAKTQIPVITKKNQILVKVEAASINPIDFRMRDGYGATIFRQTRKFKDNVPEFPLTLGRDFSGVVAEAGKQVTHVKEGDDVWGMSYMKQGTHAQYVLVENDEIGAKPRNLSHVEAASIPYVAMTVWTALCTTAGLRPENYHGKHVLVHAGAGGIGSFAIQLLKAWGAEVTTTCSSDAKQLVMDLGANHAVDYKTKNVKRELRQIGKFDVIVDGVGGQTEEYSLGLLKHSSDAKYLSLRSPIMLETDSLGLVRGGVSAGLQMIQKSVKLKNRFHWVFASPHKEALQHVQMLVEKEQIKPVIDKIFAFSELPEAMAHVEMGRARGKTVVDKFC